jgi:hypothetical protein
MTTKATMMKKAIVEATTTITTTIRSSSHQYRYNHSSKPALLRLNDVLTTPSAVASALDWKKLNGSVLTLNIHSNRISAAVATHPSSMISSTRTKPPPSSSARSLPDIPLGRRATVTDDTRQRLQDSITRIMRDDDHPICGVVVAWPIQPDTGRMGAACGRVLHTLDQLLLPINPTTTTSDANANANDDAQDLATTNTTTTPSSSFVSSTAHHHDHQHQQRRRKQPLWCLWDAGDHTTTPPPPDEWGRSSAFAGPSSSTTMTTTTTTIHRASLEQYSTDEALTAMEVWDHFCQAHWPELRAAEVVVAPQSSSYQGHHHQQHQQQKQQQQQWSSTGTTSSTTILKKKKKTLSNNRSGEPRQWAASICHPQQGSIAAHHHA